MQWRWSKQKKEKFRDTCQGDLREENLIHLQRKEEKAEMSKKNLKEEEVIL